MRFEAGWGTDDTTCIAHPRILEHGSLETIGRHCPGQFTGLLGAGCTEERAIIGLPGTLLLNRS